MLDIVPSTQQITSGPTRKEKSVLPHPRGWEGILRDLISFTLFRRGRATIGSLELPPGEGRFVYEPPTSPLRAAPPRITA